MSRAAALHLLRRVAACLVRKTTALVLASAGATTMRTYALCAELSPAGLAWERVTFAQMDEFAGLAPDDPRAFAVQLRHALAGPLAAARWWFIPGDGDDRAVQRHEQRLVSHGIDIVVHGIGGNGHLAYNEPGTSFDSLARIVDIAPASRAAVRTRFGRRTEIPGKALTMGMASLSGARHAMLLASGAAKRDAMHRALCGPVTEAVPGSILQRHADMDCFVDHAAGAGIDGSI